jgi:pimeloyl-ACP methyl ester carboxylesterase
VHTKIYPRYKTRRSLEVVAEDFSSWLAPHESADGDVILLGHSMGGLLSAEVVLLPSQSPFVSTQTAFRHRILGIINFDVPFLGMHPGVVTSGLASLFRSADSPPQTASESSGGGSSTQSLPGGKSSSTLSLTPVREDTLFSEPTDPYYNAPFDNDVPVIARKGWRSTMHFINKHSDGLRQATKQYIKSHAEFSGAMADYRGLHARYKRIRGLEEEVELVRQRAVGRTGVNVPRVRFVNYYTASAGRTKKLKAVERLNADGPGASSRSSLELSRTPSPRISVEEIREDGVVSVPLEEPPEPDEVPVVQADEEDDDNSDDWADAEDLTPLETNITDTSIKSNDTELAEALSSVHVALPAWPPLSPPPMEPTAPDLSLFNDKNVQTALKREHERKLKAYKQSMKDREVILADRKKVEDGMRKAAAKEVLKKRKAEEKEAKKEGKEVKKASIQDAKQPSQQNNSLSTSQTDGSSSAEQSDRGTGQLSLTSTMSSNRSTSPARSIASDAETEKGKAPKDRRFCVLPSKNEKGERDYTWVRVFMKDMDTVTAHCGLFFVSETYEQLVGDVGSRIEEWVRAASS